LAFPHVKPNQGNIFQVTHENHLAVFSLGFFPDFYEVLDSFRFGRVLVQPVQPNAPEHLVLNDAFVFQNLQVFAC
jgi:hypothetical protein